MSISDYQKALRIGERSYREHLNNGDYPYLQVLEELLNHTDITSEVSLGLVDIPAELIKGTFAAGRRTAFAPDFMPLLHEGSEFATKWSLLSDSHLEEGIHDPIKAYEYMNRYYVMEGNKRVSVLKYFGAATIPGNVTRLIPVRTESKENKVYFEFLQFYKVCPINYLIFSELGRYDEFLDYCQVSPSHIWTENERMDLRSLFVRFDNAFTNLGGKNLSKITTADALLVYVRIYGYKESIEKVPDEIQDELSKIWDEILLLTENQSVKILMNAEEAPKKSFWGKLLGGDNSSKVLRVAFIHAKNLEDSSWTYGHELGRAHLEEVFKDEIQTSVYNNVDPETEIDQVLEEIIAKGIDIIFATTPVFMDACLKAAINHPEVKILDCALNASHRYIRTYYGRSYEAKFLSGVIAGCMTDNDKIGYTTDYPIPVNIANLNAFSLGVKMVNPRAKIHICWSSVVGAKPSEHFKEENIHIISGKDLITPSSSSREFGLYRQTEQGPVNLAMPIWNWGVLYQKLIESIQNGAWEVAEKNSKRHALNYWWGMASDVIDLICSQHVPADTVRLVNFLKDSICTGIFEPFSGIITSQNGPITTNPEERLSPKQIITMDWLCDNVVGKIPEFDELNEDGKAILMVQGDGKEKQMGDQKDQ